VRVDVLTAEKMSLLFFWVVALSALKIETVCFS
jgi:hypothetical protein